MDFKNARERYMTNPDFHRLIDTLDDLIWITRLKILEESSGLLKDLSPEQMKVFDDAVKRRPLRETFMEKKRKGRKMTKRKRKKGGD